MGVPAKDALRRPWSEADKHRLIRLWEGVGSVVLIAYLLDRPVGSVQTEASRLQLPRRGEDKNRHRKKWTDDEDAALMSTVEDCRDGTGRVRIIEVARRANRSIDAVVNRMAEITGERRDLKDLIRVTEAEIMAFGAEQAARLAPVVDPTVPKTPIDTRNVPRMRGCLTCQKPFWSTGAGNRICPKCRSGDSGDWD